MKTFATRHFENVTNLRSPYFIGSLTVTIFLVFTGNGCASTKRGKNPVSEPTVAAIPSIIVPNQIEFQRLENSSLQLEAVSPLEPDQSFELDCTTEVCKERLTLSPDGVLTYKAATADSAASQTYVGAPWVRVVNNSSKGPRIYLNISENSETYNSGDTWSRQRVTSATIPKIRDLALRIASQKTDFMEGDTGSAFLLGNINQEYLIAVPQHVFDSFKTAGVATCDDHRIYLFKSTGYKMTCKKVIWTSKKFDLTIIAVGDHDAGTNMGNFPMICADKNFSTTATPLMTLGLGRYQNPYSYITYTDESDCVLLSNERATFNLPKKNSFGGKLVAQADYGVASCDISVGDSGAPLLNKSTGNLLGLILGANKSCPLVIPSEALKTFFAEGRSNIKDLGNATFVWYADALAEMSQDSETDSSLLPYLKALTSNVGNGTCQ